MQTHMTLAIDPGKCVVRICKMRLGSVKSREDLRKEIENTSGQVDHLKWSKLQASKLVRKLEGQMQQEIGGRDFHRDIDSAMDSCQLINLIHRMNRLYLPLNNI